MEELKNFLLKFSGDENTNINYRPYEYSALVESIPFRVALSRIEKDFEETKFVFNCYGLSEEQALEGTMYLWEKHIVVY